jgi:NADP-dependent aldehyde dehydrogenase
MSLSGEILVGGARLTSADRFYAVDPASGEPLEPAFSAAGPAHVDQACAAAWAAFDVYRETSLETRARFLEAIADQIMALGEELIERTVAESGLPRGRVEGERARTAGQLRLFAAVVRAGDWIGARIDPALPDRMPAPRPDLRLRHIPLGPVAVFGASNFPLAFSTAGGDTASALSAGCPVVVKGHPAHPGAGELVARAVLAAAASEGLPDGVFSYLPGPSNELGAALVGDPRIKAVGFTGSRRGGLALCALAAARPEPIPVFAEMSSINPVYLLPAALGERAEALGAAFVASLTQGAGQFCTNPGLVIALEGSGLDRFAAAAAEALAASQPAVMLTPGIHQAYAAGLAALEAHAAVETLAAGPAAEGPNLGRGAIFSTTAQAFLADQLLAAENFGASSLLVRCPDLAAMQRVSEALEGQLTATLHLAGADHAIARELIPVLERKVGRILVNGWPTGVEVTHAMVHGGPFPATSDSRTTSVGGLAIRRFLRPVCYQDMPDDLLPDALKPTNPLGLRRLVNGRPVQV